MKNLRYTIALLLAVLIAASSLFCAFAEENPSDPVSAEPVATEPVSAEPVATEPVSTESVATEPASTEPEATEPVTTEPVTTEPVATEPVVYTPAAPKLSSVANAKKGIELKWNKTAYAKSYTVYKKTTGSYKKLATTTKTSYTDAKVKNNKKYSYKVKANGEKKSSGYSNAKSVLRVAVASLKLTNTAKTVKVKIGKLKGATKYLVQYKKSSAKSYKNLYKGKKLSAVFKKPSAGTTYDFRVRAYVKTKAGAYSSPKSFTFLKAPTGIDVMEPYDMSGLRITWNKVKGAKGYIIYRSLNRKTSYKKVATLSGGSTLAYLDTSLTGIETYKYYVKAYNGSAKSVASKSGYDIYGKYEGKPLTLTLSKKEVFRDIHIKLVKLYALGYITSWKSSNTSICKVSSVGVLTAGNKAGKATITAEGDYNNKHRKVQIKVTVK